MFAQIGQAAELRAGPYVAARLGAWSLLRADDTLCCRDVTIESAAMVVVDTFWIGQGLDCWLDCGRAWWIFRAITLDVLEPTHVVIRAVGIPEIRVK